LIEAGDEEAPQEMGIRFANEPFGKPCEEDLPRIHDGFKIEEVFALAHDVEERLVAEQASPPPWG